MVAIVRKKTNIRKCTVLGLGLNTIIRVPMNTLVTKTKDKEGSYEKGLNIATSRFAAISLSLTS